MKAKVKRQKFGIKFFLFSLIFGIKFSLFLPFAFLLLPCSLTMHSKETSSAIDGTVLRRIKRNCCVSVAFGAMNGDFDFLFDSCLRRGLRGGDAFVFGLLASATAFRWISQAFVAEKFLFADSPNKILTAVNTID